MTPLPNAQTLEVDSQSANGGGNAPDSMSTRSTMTLHASACAVLWLDGSTELSTAVVKMVTPTYTVALLQLAIMLDPRAKPASPLSAIMAKRSGRSCQGHQSRNKTHRNSTCTGQMELFFALQTVTLRPCSSDCVHSRNGEEKWSALVYQ